VQAFGLDIQAVSSTMLASEKPQSNRTRDSLGARLGV
jgi:hypothetical protein